MTAEDAGTGDLRGFETCLASTSIGKQFERAAALVAAHRDALSQLSAQLLNAESLDGGAVRAALSSAAGGGRVLNKLHNPHCAPTNLRGSVCHS
jgi:hypothetical protein